MGDVAKRKQKAPDLPDNWDPRDDEKVWYRSNQTGDLGWMRRRDGKPRIKLDRPQEDFDVDVPFSKDRWKVDNEHRPMGLAQAIRVAFDADKQLCLTLGLHDKARVDWVGLDEVARRKWMEEGPSTPLIRRIVYRAIRSALEPLTRAQ